METFNWLSEHWLLLLGIGVMLSSLLGAVGKLVPDAWGGEYLRRAGTDVAWFVEQIRGWKPPPPPPAALALIVALGAALALSACTPKAIIRGVADVSVTTCQVLEDGLQDEPEWLKVLCDVIDVADPLILKLPRDSAAAVRLAGPRRDSK